MAGQPTSPVSLCFYLTDDKLLANTEHVISGKLHLEMTQPSKTATFPKYNLDSDSHNLILWCLKKDDPIAEEIDSYGNESKA